MWAVGKAGIKDPCKAFDSSTWKNISWEDKDHTESRLGCIGDVRCFLETSMSWRCHVGPGRRASEDQGVDRDAAEGRSGCRMSWLSCQLSLRPLPFFSEPPLVLLSLFPVGEMAWALCLRALPALRFGDSMYVLLQAVFWDTVQ